MSRPAASAPRLPTAVRDAARIYLRPVGLTCGKAADKLAAAGRARRLAGGPWSFAACEVVLRTPKGVPRATAALEDIEAWADGLEAKHRERVKGQLERLVAARLAPGGAPLARPLIMGVIDATPHPTAGGDGGFDVEAAVAQGRWLATAGADLLEVVGGSARHGPGVVAPEVETARILPVIRGLADLPAITVSIDTQHAAVAATALDAGATMISDGAVLTGDRRGPSTLVVVRANPRKASAKGDFVLEVFDDLEARVEAELAAGIPRRRLIVEPGLDPAGHGPDSLAILSQLALFHALGCPLLLGLPRDGAASDPGGAAVLRALDQGAQVLRTRDVTEIRRALDLWERLIASGR